MQEHSKSSLPTNRGEYQAGWQVPSVEDSYPASGRWRKTYAEGRPSFVRVASQVGSRVVGVTQYSESVLHNLPIKELKL